MRRYAFVLILAVPVLVAARATDGRPVRNSFIDRPVGEISDLIAHVKSDKIVADRYERHFGMSRPMLLKFLGGLHRGRLAKDGIFTIYSVPPGGWIKMHVGRINKGEPMFLDASGRPTLVARCGNPITKGPTRPQQENPLAAVPKNEADAREIESDLTAERTAETLALFEPTLMASPVAEVPDQSILVCDVIPTVPASGVSGTSILGSLSLLTPLFALDHHTSIPPQHSEPVPEPATFLVIAAGAGLAAKKRRKS